jgi:hypothetical protein
LVLTQHYQQKYIYNTFVIFYNTGNVGIGTNNPNGTLELYSTIQNSARIIWSGKEFYDNVAITSGGIALLCGVNRVGNKPLWITTLTQNTTNKIIRCYFNSKYNK